MIEVTKGGGHFFIIKRSATKLVLTDSECFELLLKLATILNRWCDGCRIVVED